MKKAFTLIELMIVVLVLGVVAAVIVPNYSVFMKGNRMRLSVKSVILAGKYAKSVAVLRQKETAVTFNFDSKLISVNFANIQSSPSASFAEDGFVDFEENELGGFEAIVSTQKVNISSEDRLQGIDVVERRLEDGIVFESIELDRSVSADESFGTYSDGVCTVVYYTNGRCEPYKVVLKHANESGHSATISVDPLGFVETTYEK